MVYSWWGKVFKTDYRSQFIQCRFHRTYHAFGDLFEWYKDRVLHQDSGDPCMILHTLHHRLELHYLSFQQVIRFVFENFLAREKHWYQLCYRARRVNQCRCLLLPLLLFITDSQSCCTIVVCFSWRSFRRCPRESPPSTISIRRPRP